MSRCALTMSLSIALSISGCTRTVYVDRPIEHRVEVSRPCLQVADVPAPPRYAMARLEPGVSDGQIVLALREEIAERADYQRVLQEVLQGCVSGAW